MNASVPGSRQASVSSPRSERPRRPLDRATVGLLFDGGGALLLVAMTGWLLLVAEVTDGNAAGAVGIVLLSAVVYGASSAISRNHPWIAAFAITVAMGIYAVARIGVLFERPIGGPLGYSNAAGSLFMLAAGAGLLVVARASDPAIRLVCGGVALGFAAVPWLNDTTTAAVLVTLLPIGLAVRGERGARRAVVGSAVTAGSSLVVVVWLGANYRVGSVVPEWIASTLSERRLVLWREAIDLFLANPATGVGPDRFPLVSRTALGDSDTLWPHNEMLHFAAEAGLPGLILLLALFVWCFARLWWGGRDAGAAVAAISLGAIAVQSNVDYVLHYPAVALLAAALVGIGAQSPATAADPVPSAPRRR